MSVNVAGRGDIPPFIKYFFADGSILYKEENILSRILVWWLMERAK